MTSPVVGLLTDFGTRDYFVPAVKAVILSINPEVRIVDISHEVKAFSTRQAAFLLWAVAPYFPEGAVFLVVVDPGVGSSRRILVVHGKKHFYVGPDNGVLSPALEAEGWKEVRELRTEKFFLPSSSRTFEGRDKMAPVVGWLSRGVPLKEFGPPVSSWEKIFFPPPRILSQTIHGEVLFIDRFGNLITNIPGMEFKEWLRNRAGQNIRLDVGGVSCWARYGESFFSVPPKKMALIVGSCGYLEVAVREASAAKKLKARVGARIMIRTKKVK